LKLGFCLVAAAAFMTASAFAQTDGTTGRWLTENGKGVIAIAPCGESICGKIDWLVEPFRDGKPAHDIHNDDPALQSRPLCGLTILYGFRHDPSDPRQWQEGHIYSPESGDTYHANITVVDADHIRLRGYVGIPLLGESQLWTRADQKHPPCHAG
jgi:uncharacterized protein (DUF2147 family)